MAVIIMKGGAPAAGAPSVSLQEADAGATIEQSTPTVEEPVVPTPKKTRKPRGPKKPKVIPEVVTPNGELPLVDASKYKRINELSDDNRAVLHGMYADNKSIAYIAETLNHMGLFTDVKPASLKQYLYRYKWDVIDKQIMIRAETIAPSVKARLVSEITQDLNVHHEVAELVLAQKARVTKMLKREAEMPMLFNSLGGEIRTLSSLLEQYSTLSFDLGLLKRVPKVTKVTSFADATMIESDGKEHVVQSVNRSQTLKEAADEFFNLLAIDGESEDITNYE